MNMFGAGSSEATEDAAKGNERGIFDTNDLLTVGGSAGAVYIITLFLAAAAKKYLGWSDFEPVLLFVVSQVVVFSLYLTQKKADIKARGARGIVVAFINGFLVMSSAGGLNYVSVSISMENEEGVSKSSIIPFLDEQVWFKPVELKEKTVKVQRQGEVIEASVNLQKENSKEIIKQQLTIDMYRSAFPEEKEKVVFQAIDNAVEELGNRDEFIQEADLKAETTLQLKLFDHDPKQAPAIIRELQTDDKEKSVEQNLKAIDVLDKQLKTVKPTANKLTLPEVTQQIQQVVISPDPIAGNPSGADVQPGATRDSSALNINQLQQQLQLQVELKWREQAQQVLQKQKGALEAIQVK